MVGNSTRTPVIIRANYSSCRFIDVHSPRWAFATAPMHGTVYRFDLAKVVFNHQVLGPWIRINHDKLMSCGVQPLTVLKHGMKIDEVSIERQNTQWSYCTEKNQLLPSGKCQLTRWYVYCWTNSWTQVLSELYGLPEHQSSSRDVLKQRPSLNPWVADWISILHQKSEKNGNTLQSGWLNYLQDGWPTYSLYNSYDMGRVHSPANGSQSASSSQSPKPATAPSAISSRALPS